MQRVILYLILISRFLHLIKASAHFNRLNSATSAAITYDNQETWQPMSRNNWIILQTAEQNPHTYTNMKRHNMNTNSHTSHPPSQTQSQRYPTNYYAYNHSAGNYQPPTPEVKVVEPFVLAISNVRRSTDFSSGGEVRRKAPVPLASISSKLPPKDFVKKMNSSGATAMPRRADVRWKMFDSDADNADNIVTDMLADVAEDVDDNSSGGDDDDERLNEILVPLENALDKVRQFCDIAKRIISDDEEIDGNELDTAAALATPVAQATSVLDEVQGRANSSPNTQQPLSKKTAHPITATDTAALSIGTGRKIKKLKKKFKKFLLPLLIAYKLKFLTLVPVLIGGLTLLVGTTGLAGFFFALFTAVMSLKSSGGSKSIVVKKIL